MHPVIHFRSALFDVSREPENPINPIRGVSLLEWLRKRVPADLEMSTPEPEDWGWFSSVAWKGRSYMVGASVNESADGNHEWVLQFEKLRSLKERLLGQGKFSSDDPCFAYFQGSPLSLREPALIGGLYRVWALTIRSSGPLRRAAPLSCGTRQRPLRTQALAATPACLYALWHESQKRCCGLLQDDGRSSWQHGEAIASTSIRPKQVVAAVPGKPSDGIWLPVQILQ